VASDCDAVSDPDAITTPATRAARQTPLLILATLPQNFPWVWDPEDLRIRPT